MKPHIAPDAQAELAGLFQSKSLRAIDVWKDPARRPLWRANRSATSAPAAVAPPEHGGTSPMGYWLCPTSEAMPAGDGPELTFVTPGDDPGPVPAALARSADRACARPVQTVRLKSPNVGDGDLTLTIGPGGARVVATPGAWKSMAEPVLLAACLYWRFAAIDAEIARLTELAHGDLDHSNMPGTATLKVHGRVVAAARDVRALVLDLPHFEGPLTDPFPYCSSERSAQVFENLAEKLLLEPWCELIDERAEAVEDAYEALTEKLFEYKNFAWEAVLETIIIVLLIGELAVMAYETFS